MKKSLVIGALCVASSTAWTSSAFAQAEIVPEAPLETASAEKDVEGWNPSLSGNATLNFVSNSNVVGQVEGLSILVGLGLTGGIDYVNGPHLWRNTLSINESFARTPVVDEFLKTNDVVDLESMYNYFFLDWVGAFARLNFNTSLFSAEIVTAEDANYTLTSADTTTTEARTTSRLTVSDPFNPFTISESIGVFAEPYATDPLAISLRLGIGGRHTFAENSFINADNADTEDVIELQELSDVQQAGLELFAGASGKMQDGRLTYGLGVSALLPFINNDTFERSATELLRVGVKGNVSVTVFEWMALVYNLNITSDPQLFPQDEELVQIQNSLLLNLQYTFVDRKEGIKKLEEDASVKAAKEEAAAAEQRAAEAEQRAKDLEMKLKAAEEAKKLEAEQAAKAAEAAKQAAEAEEAAKKAAEQAPATPPTP